MKKTLIHAATILIMYSLTSTCMERDLIEESIVEQVDSLYEPSCDQKSINQNEQTLSDEKIIDVNQKWVNSWPFKAPHLQPWAEKSPLSMELASGWRHNFVNTDAINFCFHGSKDNNRPSLQSSGWPIIGPCVCFSEVTADELPGNYRTLRELERYLYALKHMAKDGYKVNIRAFELGCTRFLMIFAILRNPSDYEHILSRVPMNHKDCYDVLQCIKTVHLHQPFTTASSSKEMIAQSTAIISVGYAANAISNTALTRFIPQLMHGYIPYFATCMAKIQMLGNMASMVKKVQTSFMDQVMVPTAQMFDSFVYNQHIAQQQLLKPSECAEERYPAFLIEASKLRVDEVSSYTGLFAALPNKNKALFVLGGIDASKNRRNCYRQFGLSYQNDWDHLHPVSMDNYLCTDANNVESFLKNQLN